MFREKVINHPKLLEVGVAKYLNVSELPPPYPSRLTGGQQGQGHGVVLHVQGEEFWFVNLTHTSPVLNRTLSRTKYQSLGLTLLNARSSFFFFLCLPFIANIFPWNAKIDCIWYLITKRKPARLLHSCEYDMMFGKFLYEFFALDGSMGVQTERLMVNYIIKQNALLGWWWIK